MYAKGDVELPKFLVECKQTVHASIRIEWLWLAKITEEAHAVQKEPAVAIEIQGGAANPIVDRDWVMIPARCFRAVVASLEAL